LLPYLDIIAYFLGDGTVEKLSNKPYFSSKYYGLLYLYKCKIQSFFPNAMPEIRKYVKNNRCWSPEYRLYINNPVSKLAIMLKRHYILLTYNKVSECLTQNLREQENAVLFVKGLFDAEGSLYWKERHGAEIKFATSSEALRALLEHSLITIGLKYVVNVGNRKDAKHKKKVYYVRLFGKNAQYFILLTKPYKLMLREYIEDHVSFKYREKLMNLLSMRRLTAGGAVSRRSRPVRIRVC